MWLDDDPGRRPQGTTPHYLALYEEAGRPLGFAVYRIRQEWREGRPAGTLLLERLIAATPSENRAEQERARRDPVKVSMDRIRCEGHARCMEQSPEVFEVRADDKSYVLIEEPPGREGEMLPPFQEAALRAFRACSWV